MLLLLDADKPTCVPRKPVALPAPETSLGLFFAKLQGREAKDRSRSSQTFRDLRGNRGGRAPTAKINCSSFGRYTIYPPLT